MLQKINTMCSCKNLKCKIHGNCKECIEHHKEHGQPHCKRPENLEAVKEMRKLPFIIWLKRKRSICSFYFYNPILLF